LPRFPIFNTGIDETGVSLFAGGLGSRRVPGRNRRRGAAPQTLCKKDVMKAALEARRPAPDVDNADALFNELYSELHRLARRELHRQGSIGGLGVTTLLHEAYLSISAKEGVAFVDHARFMGYAARVMRGLIIDDVRRRRSQKRGGLFEITSLRTYHGEHVADPNSLLRISDALDELAEVEPDLAEIIDMKFFCGLSFAEIAAVRGVSERTIQRNWEKGRLYLHHAIGDAGSSGAKLHAATQR
jgi:RNA polymerase sigma factor (TIGR02999 family)